MPTPIQLLTDPVALGIMALYLTLMLWEALFPARPLPPVRFWRLKGIAAFFAYFFLSSYLPLWYGQWLPTGQLLDLSEWPAVPAILAGVLVYELGLYLWHRAMHRNDTLWRIFHQMHHSAERLDTYGAFFFSPFDMIGFTLLGTLCFSLFMGLPPAAITAVLLVTNFFSIFQHANIRTPVWLGYILQRPESHAVHHGRGIHAYNYSDLPVFDMLFGTFRNPAGYVRETGFYPGASERVGDMLTFQDVSHPHSSATQPNTAV